VLSAPPAVGLINDDAGNVNDDEMMLLWFAVAYRV